MFTYIKEIYYMESSFRKMVLFCLFTLFISPSQINILNTAVIEIRLSRTLQEKKVHFRYLNFVGKLCSLNTDYNRIFFLAKPKNLVEII